MVPQGPHGECLVALKFRESLRRFPEECVPRRAVELKVKPEKLWRGSDANGGKNVALCQNRMPPLVRPQHRKHIGKVFRSFHSRRKYARLSPLHTEAMVSPASMFPRVWP